MARQLLLSTIKSPIFDCTSPPTCWCVPGNMTMSSPCSRGGECCSGPVRNGGHADVTPPTSARPMVSPWESTPASCPGGSAARSIRVDLLASRVWFSPRGVRLGALGAEERLLHASIHARPDGSPSDLLAQRDVVQLVLRDDLALRRLERLASSWRLEAVLADAVRRAWDTFAVPDVVPISAWSRSYRPHRRDRRRLASHSLPPAPQGGKSCGDLGAMDVVPGSGS